VLGGNSNVISQTGEKFAGPLAFVDFWFDAIAEWQKETGKKGDCRPQGDERCAGRHRGRRGPRVAVTDMR
jgi:hypothetical protein